jgi:hypothetical protein
MPAPTRGFLFNWFDKIVCGLVALLLVAAAGYALSRQGVARGTLSAEQVQEAITRVKSSMRATAGTPEKVDWLTKVEQSLRKVSDPQVIRPYLFFWPLPHRYERISIPLSQSFYLEFDAPLEAGTLSVRNPDLLELVEHPVGNDYKLVYLRSGMTDGDTLVSGMAGRVRHDYPILIDPEAGRTVLRPTSITATPAVGSVTLTIGPNARNGQEGVEVESYEIWRRDWVNPLGDYRKVGSAAADGGARARATGSMSRPGAFRAARGVAPGMGAQAEPVTWEDRRVEPGEKYSYRTRTVGANTYPRESEFTDPVDADVPPQIDYKFTSLGLDRLRFSVAKGVEQGVRKADFWVSIGDEIGGVVVDPQFGETESYLTGVTLLEIHASVLRPLRGRMVPSHRAFCADKDGNVRILWFNEDRSALWDIPQVGTGPAAGRSARFMGPEAGMGGRYR